MSKQLVESDVKLAHSFTINLLYLIIVSIAARAMVAVSELWSNLSVTHGEIATDNIETSCWCLFIDWANVGLEMTTAPKKI